jgi:hypothetical protein
MSGAATPTTDGARIEALKQRLDDPQVADALTSLLDHADLVAILVQGANDLLSRSGAVSKTLSSYVSDLRTAGQGALGESLSSVNFQEVTKSLFALGHSLGESQPAITRLVESDTISPDAIDLIALAARSLVTGYTNAVEQDVHFKLRSLPSILHDPDVDRALGFLVEVVRAMGVAMRTEPIALSTSRSARPQDDQRKRTSRTIHQRERKA